MRSSATTGCLIGGGGKPSPKRVALATVEQVLGLYRDRYFDLNVRHFHEKLRQEHGIALSYTWVKQALHGAGLVQRGRKRECIASGVHGGLFPACSCTSIAAGIAGFRMSAGTTCW
jgi:hypothetical protein